MSSSKGRGSTENNELDKLRQEISSQNAHKLQELRKKIKNNEDRFEEKIEEANQDLHYAVRILDTIASKDDKSDINLEFWMERASKTNLGDLKSLIQLAEDLEEIRLHAEAAILVGKRADSRYAEIHDFLENKASEMDIKPTKAKEEVDELLECSFHSESYVSQELAEMKERFDQLDDRIRKTAQKFENKIQDSSQQYKDEKLEEFRQRIEVCKGYETNQEKEKLKEIYRDYVGKCQERVKASHEKSRRRIAD